MKKIFIGVVIIAMLLAACENPFFPEKAVKGTPDLVLSPLPLVFDTITNGDPQPDAKTITITNNGTSTASVTSIALYTTGENYFLLGGKLNPIIPAGNDAVFTVQPIDELDAGTYNTIITVTYNKKTVTLNVSITVELQEPVINLLLENFIPTDASEGVFEGIFNTPVILNKSNQIQQINLPAELTGIEWYLENIPLGSGDSVNINPAAINTGVYTLYCFFMMDGNPWLGSISITIE